MQSIKIDSVNKIGKKYINDEETLAEQIFLGFKLKL
jgi:hypothetical protein